MPTPEEIEKRDALRLAVLWAAYDFSNGSTRVQIHDPNVYVKMSEVPKEDVREALHFLTQHGLLRLLGTQSHMLTHAGCIEVEAATREPTHRTTNFTARVVKQVHNHINGNVGAIVNGSNNTTNVVQNVGLAPAELASLIAELRQGVSELHEEQRAEATEFVDTIELQAASPRPQKAIVKVCGDALTKTFGLAANAAGAELVKRVFAYFGGI